MSARSQGPTSRTAATAASDEASVRFLTIPNVLCIIRLAGSAALVPLGITGQHGAFVVLFVFLAMTDWVDGKLAVLLNQRSVVGARLDSWADVSLYSALLVGGVCLQGAVLVEHLWWIGTAVASYAVTTGAGYWKFGRWPSYHTRAAKTCWLLITVGAICLLAGWTLWPFRLALVAVTLTNIEATLITWMLPSWRANVPSLYHAMQRVNAGSTDESQEPIRGEQGADAAARSDRANGAAQLKSPGRIL